MNKAKKHLNDINALKQQLNPTDLEYFDNLQVYLSTSGLFFNEDAVYLQLLSMLQDLIDAQQDHLSAEDFFGNNPKTMANEILQQLPKPKLREQINLLLMIFGISWFFLLLSSQNSDEGLKINLLAFLLLPILETIVIEIMMQLLHHSIYSPSTNKFINRLKFFLMGLIFFFCVLVMLSLNYLHPIGYSLLVPTPWHYWLLSILVVVTTLYLGSTILQHRNKQN